MGKLYNVKCTHCGYSFRAEYGDERAKDNIVNMKREFEEGKAERELQGIFDALRNTVSEREERDNREFAIQYANESGEDLQEALLLFKAPRISDPWHVYECFECKKFFIRKRISIICEKGEFEEKYVKCPECGDPLAAPVDEKDFHPKKPENTDGSICDAECPICNEYLTVISWGFWD